jgi:hypothetical protein
MTGAVHAKISRAPYYLNKILIQYRATPKGGRSGMWIDKEYDREDDLTGAVLRSSLYDSPAKCPSWELLQDSGSWGEKQFQAAPKENSSFSGGTLTNKQKKARAKAKRARKARKK